MSVHGLEDLTQPPELPPELPPEHCSGDMQTSPAERRHNKNAPYWAVAFVLSMACGLSTLIWKPGGFWNGYVLDMTGPAWNYILFRRLSYAFSDNLWTRFFTPTRTLVLFVLFAYGIEMAQYLELYDSTFDPWDFIAYVSLLIPMYLIDRFR